MKASTLISVAAISLSCTSLPGMAANAPQSGDKYEGVLSQITDTTVTLDSSRSFRFDPRMAKCFDFRGDKTTCETLIAIGYADKARITLVGGIVQRVDILALQQ